MDEAAHGLPHKFCLTSFASQVLPHGDQSLVFARAAREKSRARAGAWGSAYPRGGSKVCQRGAEPGRVLFSRLRPEGYTLLAARADLTRMTAQARERALTA